MLHRSWTPQWIKKKTQKKHIIFTNWRKLWKILPIHSQLNWMTIITEQPKHSNEAVLLLLLLLLLTTWRLKCPTEPIVVAWLLLVCFSGSLISRRKSERAPWTVALPDHRLRGQNEMISIITPRIIAPPLWDCSPPSQDYYFWQCLPQEGTFADLMGPGPLYAAFCMALCHQLHTEERGRENEKDRETSTKVSFKQEFVYVILKTN